MPLSQVVALACERHLYFIFKYSRLSTVSTGASADIESWRTLCQLLFLLTLGTAWDIKGTRTTMGRHFEPQKIPIQRTTDCHPVEDLLLYHPALGQSTPRHLHMVTRKHRPRTRRPHRPTTRSRFLTPCLRRIPARLPLNPLYHMNRLKEMEKERFFWSIYMDSWEMRPASRVSRLMCTILSL